MVCFGFVSQKGVVINTQNNKVKTAIDEQAKSTLEKISERYNERYNADKMAVTILSQLTEGDRTGDTLKTFFWKWNKNYKSENMFFRIYQDADYTLVFLKEPKVMMLRSVKEDTLTNTVQLSLNNQLDSLLKIVERVSSEKNGFMVLYFPDKINGFNYPLRKLYITYDNNYDLLKTEYFYRNGRLSKQELTIFTDYKNDFDTKMLEDNVLARVFDTKGKVKTELKEYKFKDLRSKPSPKSN